MGAASDFPAQLNPAALSEVLATRPWLYILDIDRRLLVWEAWLTEAGLEDHICPRNELEFSTLDQVIHAALAGLGIAIADRHMVERELANGSLVQLSPVEVPGQYGYWLDIRPEVMEAARVRHFTNWLKGYAEAAESLDIA